MRGPNDLGRATFNGMKLHFYGGAQSVTGANYLLESGDLKILVDCGLFQGSRYSETWNYEPFPFDPREIDYVLITHSHADHMGRIPKLYRDGFRGQIITTEPTKAIMSIALDDSLDKIRDEANQDGHAPLYRKDHIHKSLEMTHTVQYRHPVRLHERATATFHEVSHILGSAAIEIVVRDVGTTKRILFSGDVGNPPTLLLNPIDYVRDADYVIIESAYGNRLHENRNERRDILQEVITETVDRGGVLMIPSFAIERIQELLLEFHVLFQEQRIPEVPVFVDSPLAIKITNMYGQYSRYFRPEAIDMLKESGGLFQFPWLTFTPTVAESKEINSVPAPKVIIAGSGMSQGGRILHHEIRYLPDEQNTILFIGYQVQGSLGRKIFDREPLVQILGQSVAVRSRVEAIGGYSAHADQTGLLEFVARANEGRGIKKVFIVQGESDSALALAEKITEKISIPAMVPRVDEIIAI